LLKKQKNLKKKKLSLPEDLVLLKHFVNEYISNL
jgi:hypothetical protein